MVVQMVVCYNECKLALFTCELEFVLERGAAEVNVQCLVNDIGTYSMSPTLRHCKNERLLCNPPGLVWDSSGVQRR